MRGLLATALLAPALASALVVPNTWDGVHVASATHTEISHVVHLSIPIVTTTPDDPVSNSILGFRIDLARAGPECGSGDLVVNGIPVSYGTIGALEFAEYLGLNNILMQWSLTCGPLTRTLEFAVKNVNGEPVNDLGLTVLYSHDDTSLEILDIKKYSKNPKPIYLAVSSSQASYTFKGQKPEEDSETGAALPVPHGEQAPISEKPVADDVDAVQGIALCDSVKCVFMIAVHNTKETANHLKSKVKSIFCDKKPGKLHPGKYNQPDRHGGKHHEEHNDDDRHRMRPGHEERPSDDRHGGKHHDDDRHRHITVPITDHTTHPTATRKVAPRPQGHPPYPHRRRRPLLRRPNVPHPPPHPPRRRAAAGAASGCGRDESPRRRRRCGGWRRRRCRGKREYIEKDEMLPSTEPHPAYSSPSHIATEIADLRHAAEAVEDIVSQSSEGSRYARRGSADTMETLPEYTAEETDSKMGSETLPGYADSEESVSVADGYQPGTGEVWRARVDGVNVKA
ncbi:hypothetical protein VE04_00616 [Pseudogymnoascus sp. 24MN13]|nr:hypothetical protein VE04_00616 [Pseudogymnoascus sp. 24MN13]